MSGCRFCDPAYQQKGVILANEHCFANYDGHPVTEGHIKIMPKRHMETFFELQEDELLSLFALINEAKQLLDEQYHPDGYNIGINCGKAAGQTVFHLHVHVIPRYTGDVPDPTGGVRNVIPEKGNYLKNP